jgi:HEAT repeat protein
MLKSCCLKSAWLAALVLATAVANGQDPTPLLTRSQAELLKVLESDAPQKAKADACRELGVVGDRHAVPVLLNLLADPELSHMARYAMETMPDPSVDAGLRQALNNLSGRQLIGVIHSLGVRRDTRAVRPLAQRLTDSDPEVAQFAARALGQIGNREAANALQRALSTAPAVSRLAIQEGLFRCAESLSGAGRSRDALNAYEILRGLPAADQQVRAGALRGVLLTLPRSRAAALLRDSLQSPDYVLAAAAARAAMEMAGSEVTEALTSMLGQVVADRQILVLQALGNRRDPLGVGPVSSLARSEASQPVRVAAVRTLGELGDSAALGALTGLLRDSDSAVAQAAQESLASLPGRDIDAAVLSMLGNRDAAQRLAGMELVSRRRMTSAIPELFKAAREDDSRIRSSALRRLGELGSAAEVPQLLGLLAGAGSDAVRDGVEQALTAIASRATEPGPISRPVIEALVKSQPASKLVLLRVLGVVGDGPSLKAVRMAVDDPNADVHAVALRTLSTWKTADAAPELLALARSTSSATDKTLCLRGYLGWARSTELPVDRRLAMCREVAPIIQSDDEKKLFLGALGSVASVDALPLVVPHLDTDATREEAAVAVATIAEALLKAPTDKAASTALAAALEKASQAAGGDLAQRLKKPLDEAKARASR